MGKRDEFRTGDDIKATKMLTEQLNFAFSIDIQGTLIIPTFSSYFFPILGDKNLSIFHRN